MKTGWRTRIAGTAPEFVRRAGYEAELHGRYAGRFSAIPEVQQRYREDFGLELAADRALLLAQFMEHWPYLLAMREYDAIQFFGSVDPPGAFLPPTLRGLPDRRRPVHLAVRGDAGRPFDAGRIPRRGGHRVLRGQLSRIPRSTRARSSAVFRSHDGRRRDLLPRRRTGDSLAVAGSRWRQEVLAVRVPAVLAVEGDRPADPSLCPIPGNASGAAVATRADGLGDRSRQVPAVDRNATPRRKGDLGATLLEAAVAKAGSGPRTWWPINSSCPVTAPASWNRWPRASRS